MNIKSLLLGSAAALVAVSGAQAADAIVVEPEPVEYVRICDMYGTGFYYIPGTETCMRWNGYFRATYSHVDRGDDVHRVRWRHRARIHLDTRNETDWGTLRGWVRIQANSTPGASQSQLTTGAASAGTAHTHTVDTTNSNGVFGIDKFLISFSNDNSTLRVGILDHYFATNHGYAGVFAWDVMTGLDAGSDGGFYSAKFNTHFLDYTYAMDGFALTVGISSDTGYNGTNSNAAIGNVSDIDAYAGINYSADWGGFAATYVHEGGSVSADDASIWKVSADLDLSEFIPGGRLHGMYMSSDDANSYIGSAADAWQVSFQMDLSDDLAMFAQYSEIDPNGANNDTTNWSAGLQWRPVTGFRAYAAYAQTDADANTDSKQGFTFGVRRDF